MLKLVAPTIGVNYQIETGARAASLSESNSDRDNKCNWSICGGKSDKCRVSPGVRDDINATVAARSRGTRHGQIFIMFKSRIYDIRVT